MSTLIPDIVQNLQEQSGNIKITIAEIEKQPDQQQQQNDPNISIIIQQPDQNDQKEQKEPKKGNISNTDLAKILNIPSVDIPLDQRLENDFLESDPFQIQTLSDEPTISSEEDDAKLLSMISALSVPQNQKQTRPAPLTPYYPNTPHQLSDEEDDDDDDELELDDGLELDEEEEKQINPPYNTPLPRTLHMHLKDGTPTTGGKSKSKRKKTKSKKSKTVKKTKSKKSKTVKKTKSKKSKTVKSKTSKKIRTKM